MLRLIWQHEQFADSFDAARPPSKHLRRWPRACRFSWPPVPMPQTQDPHDILRKQQVLHPKWTCFRFRYEIFEQGDAKDSFPHKECIFLKRNWSTLCAWECNLRLFLPLLVPVSQIEQQSRPEKDSFGDDLNVMGTKHVRRRGSGIECGIMNSIFIPRVPPTFHNFVYDQQQKN